MPKVRCDDIEVHAGRVRDVLKPLLEDAKKKLDELNLHADAMGSIGQGAVSSHNGCRDAHVENLKKGIKDFTDLHEGLMRTAQNWRKSNRRWVIKGTPGI